MVALTPSSVNDFNYSSRAIQWTLNALGDKDMLSVSIFAGAKVVVFRRNVIDYDPANNYRQWTLVGYNTRFENTAAKYVHIAIAKEGDMATLVYPDTRLDIFGRPCSEDGSAFLEGTDENTPVSEQCYYLYIGKITHSVGQLREWEHGLPLTGNLDTDQYRNDVNLGAWDRMFRLDELNNTIVQLLPLIRIILGTDNKEINDLWRSIDTPAEGADKDKAIPSVAYLEQFGMGAFLSKVQDDEANGLIRFLKGIAIGPQNDSDYGIDATALAKLRTVIANVLQSPNFVSGVSGFTLKNENGESILEIDRLTVRKLAEFAKVQIRELAAIAGNQIQSSAASIIERVVGYDINGNVVPVLIESALGNMIPNPDVAKWRCYWTADNGTTATTNTWMVGMQARCETFNLKVPGTYDTLSNRYYWRLVTGVGEDYIEFSATDDVYNHDNSTNNSLAACIPAVADSVVQMGYRWGAQAGDGENEKSLTAFMISRTNGINAPCQESYQGVGIALPDTLGNIDPNDFWTLEGRRVKLDSPFGVEYHTKYFNLITDGGFTFPVQQFQGDWHPGTIAKMYEQWRWDDCLWQCRVASTTDEPSEDSPDWILVSGTPSKWEMLIDTGGYTDIAFGETMIVTCRVMKGNVDYTSQITQWSVTRDSGNAVADSQWTPTPYPFTGILHVRYNNDYNDIQRSDGLPTVFTFTANVAGITTYATLSI